MHSKALQTLTRGKRFGSLRAPAHAFAIAVLSLSAATSLIGQAAPQPTKVLDNSALHPPKGVPVAIVEFSDLECPACAHANPILKDAAAKYKIPWVRHDYLIPLHQWSKAAAVYARWFDEKGSGLGDAYRDAIFANQPSIYNVGVLTKFTETFASSHNIALPFAIDPQNKLAGIVQADDALGKRTGIQHTPTIFIVASTPRGDPYIEVENADKDLYRAIDQALAVAKSNAPPASHTAKK
jgi:protein-disulfide isomerase